MGLPLALMNPRKKGKKATKRAKKAVKRVAKRKKYSVKKVASAVAPKKKVARKARKASKKHRRQVALVDRGGNIRLIPTGSKIRFAKKPKFKKLKKKSIQRLSKGQRRVVKSGNPLKLRKGKRSISKLTWRNPMKRRKARRNPQFNIKKIAQMAGGAAAAIVVHKYGVLAIGNLLAKLPVIGQYAEKINSNKWVNIASKGALAVLVYKVGQKKGEVLKNASKAYAGTALALAALQIIGIDQKLMLAQSGMGEIEGIEMNGYEMNGIEMNGIEMNGIESLGDDLGEVDGYGDGMNGSEGVY